MANPAIPRGIIDNNRFRYAFPTYANHLVFTDMRDERLKSTPARDPDIVSAKNSPEKIYLSSGDRLSETTYVYSESGQFQMPENSAFLFNYHPRLEDIEGIERVSTEGVTSMHHLFNACDSLKSLDLSSWDTSKVVDMRCVFRNCNYLERLDLSGWDTSRVVTMGYMFDGCGSLKELDVSHFDTSNVTNMSGMFSWCALTKDPGFKEWDISKVTSMTEMFHRSSFEELDLSRWNTENLSLMTGMFGYCHDLKSLDLTGWNTKNAMDMSLMFEDCEKLKEINVSSFDTSNVRSMSSMFSGCSSLTSLDLTDFDTSKVRNMMQMFDGCRRLSEIKAGDFRLSNVSNMKEMFRDCRSLKSADFMKDWKPQKGVDVENMFEGCAKIGRPESMRSKDIECQLKEQIASRRTKLH